jgi:hypothetical protein
MYEKALPQNLPLSAVELHGSLARLGLLLSGHVLRVLDSGLFEPERNTRYELGQGEGCLSTYFPTDKLPVLGNLQGLKEVDPEGTDTDEPDEEVVGRQGQHETGRVGSGGEHGGVKKGILSESIKELRFRSE